MPKPQMGAKLPFYNENNKEDSQPNGSGASSNPILNTLTRPTQPAPTWGENIVANPNSNFISTPINTVNPGFNPNTDTQAGVPISNTPSTNSQDSSGFGYNMQQIPAMNSNIINALMGMGSYNSYA